MEKRGLLLEVKFALSNIKEKVKQSIMGQARECMVHHEAVNDASNDFTTKEETMFTERVSGAVKCFNGKQGYGFIIGGGTSEDIFVHRSAIKRHNYQKVRRPSVDEGEAVEFNVVDGDKGCQAVNVTESNGTPAQVSPFAAGRHRLRSRGFSSGTQYHPAFLGMLPCRAT